MDKKNEIKRLFNAGFNESPVWTDWYFSNVYNDAEAMLAYSSSQSVSCLMMGQYGLKLGKTTVGMGYISCATTMRQARGHGHMRRLINDALMEAASRGDAVVSLIPASRRLYFYYDRLGFSTVFYADEHRYTSLHRFADEERFKTVDPCFDDFSRLELSRRSTVVHSEKDFSNICADIKIDGGHVLAVTDSTTPGNSAMLFATVGDEAVNVRDILSASPEAAEAVLARLRAVVGERMFIVWSAPSDNPLFLRSRGMGRIVSVERLLEAVVAERPSVEQTIRVRDSLIPDNNAYFILHNGSVERTSSTMRRVTLDVDVDILAAIIFNSAKTGEIFSMPTFRPYMATMLD